MDPGNLVNAEKAREELINLLKRLTCLGPRDLGAEEAYAKVLADAFSTPHHQDNSLLRALEEAIKSINGGAFLTHLYDAFAKKLEEFFLASNFARTLRLGADISFRTHHLVRFFLHQTLCDWLQSVGVSRKPKLMLGRTKFAKFMRLEAAGVDIVEKFWKTEGITTWIRPVQLALEEFFNTTKGANLLTEVLKKKKPLDIIVRGDAIDLGDCTITLISLGFPSFGAISKSPYMLCLLGAVNGSDKSTADLRRWLKPVWEALQKIIDDGFFMLKINTDPPESIKVQCRAKLGGDDPFLRAMLGLMGSGSFWMCIYCTILRIREEGAHVPDKNDQPPPRELPVESRADLHQRFRSGEHPDPCTADKGYKWNDNRREEPILNLRDWEDAIFDLLHAALCLGRVLMHFLCVQYLKKLSLVISALRSKPVAENRKLLAALAVWLLTSAKCPRLGRKVMRAKDLEHSVCRGVKGSDARRLFASIDAFGAGTGVALRPEDRDKIKQMGRVLSILYIKDTTTEKAKQDLAWLRENCRNVVNDFGALCDPGQKNYLHTLANHLVDILDKHDSLYLHACDVEESLNYILASGRTNWSNSAGGSAPNDQTTERTRFRWVPQVLKRFIMRQEFLLNHDAAQINTILKETTKSAKKIVGDQIPQKSNVNK